MLSSLASPPHSANAAQSLFLCHVPLLPPNLLAPSVGVSVPASTPAAHLRFTELELVMATNIASDTFVCSGTCSKSFTIATSPLTLLQLAPCTVPLDSLPSHLLPSPSPSPSPVNDDNLKVLRTYALMVSLDTSVSFSPLTSHSPSQQPMLLSLLSGAQAQGHVSPSVAGTLRSLLQFPFGTPSDMRFAPPASSHFSSVSVSGSVRGLTLNQLTWQFRDAIRVSRNGFVFPTLLCDEMEAPFPQLSWDHGSMPSTPSAQSPGTSDLNASLINQHVNRMHQLVKDLPVSAKTSLACSVPPVRYPVMKGERATGNSTASDESVEPSHNFSLLFPPQDIPSPNKPFNTSPRIFPYPALPLLLCGASSPSLFGLSSETSSSSDLPSQTLLGSGSSAELVITDVTPFISSRTTLGLYLDACERASLASATIDPSDSGSITSVAILGGAVHVSPKPSKLPLSHTSSLLPLLPAPQLHSVAGCTFPVLVSLPDGTTASVPSGSNPNKRNAKPSNKRLGGSD